jgi:uncharacterized protein YgiM (DUF1202 family)
MKRNRFLPAAALVLALAAAAAVQAAQMSVQVRDGVLRSKPSFLGNPSGHVAYGDRVDVLAAQSGWSQVRAPSGATGWIHDSALTPKRVVLAAGSGKDVQLAASSDEVALAGKGFSQEVETEYKKQNRSLDYAWVDRMVTFKVSDAEALRFMQEGGVEP